MGIKETKLILGPPYWNLLIMGVIPNGFSILWLYIYEQSYLNLVTIGYHLEEHLCSWI